MKPRRHLLVAVHHQSWGRTEMAVRIAQDLQAAGDEVRFLIHASEIPLLEKTGFKFEVVRDHIGGLARVLFDKHVSQVRPDSVIYCDFFNTSNYLLHLGISDSEFLIGYDCPTVTLDVWDYQLTGHRIDLFGESTADLVHGDINQKISEFNRITHRLIPVPFAACDDRSGKFACLPKNSGIGSAKDWRDRLNIPADHQVVLFCTSRWQHANGSENGTGRLCSFVPKVISHYIRRLGPAVHLVHVGPKSYEFQHVLGRRYHWLPPLARNDFKKLISSADLLLSPNMCATTIATAIELNVPVIVLRNSRMVRTIDEAIEAAGGELSDNVQTLITESLPIYPFVLWPLGYYQFLSPLLTSNEYCEAFDSLELLQESSVIGRSEELLNETPARQEMIARQVNYTQQVGKLPTAADVMNGFLQ
jgi:hypothetical protein